jgi:hypothetical protein
MKNAYNTTKQVNVSLINLTFGLVEFSKILAYLMIIFILNSPVVVFNFAAFLINLQCLGNF